MSEDICLSCDENENWILDEYTFRCKCQSGFKESSITNRCEKCLMYQGECVLNCPQESVLNIEMN